jgi:hypothetical protein
MLPKRNSLATVTSLKGEKSTPAAGAKIEGFQQILDRRIIGSVTDKNDLKPSEQRLNEPACPTVREIGAPEVGT